MNKYTCSYTAAEAVISRYGVKIWGKKAVTPGNDWSVKNIAKWIVDYCMINKIEVTLALSQALLECHFGGNPSAGRSRKTLNMFNVGNVDSGANENQKSWELGIKRYCELMRNEYNWHEDADDYVTVKSMVQHDFKRPRGGRYATDSKYTDNIRVISNTIKTIIRGIDGNYTVNA